MSQSQRDIKNDSKMFMRLEFEFELERKKAKVSGRKRKSEREGGREGGKEEKYNSMSMTHKTVKIAGKYEKDKKRKKGEFVRKFIVIHVRSMRKSFHRILCHDSLEFTVSET